MRNFKLEQLQAGKTIITSEKGNSMTPLIISGQKHELTPVTDLSTIEIGDIVYCKVHGSMFTHIVKAKDLKKGFQIGNNHGHINGWTNQVYAKVTKIL